MSIKRNRVMFYSDSPFCGGHERMTALIANTVIAQDLARVQVCFSCPEIAKILDDRAIKYKLPFETKLPLPFFRNISFKDIYFVKNLLNRIKPNIFIVAQGDIEYGIKGLIGARWAKFPVISYLPMAYTFKEMRAKMASIRDKLDAIYFKIPSQFITVNNFQAKLLQRFTNGKIHIIRNPILDDDLFHNNNSRSNFKNKNLKINDCLNIGIIGRVNFRQKNQKAFIEVAKACRKNGIQAKWHIIGDGTDLFSLRKIVQKEMLADNVNFHGWLEKKNLKKILIQDIDIVFIPSHFEGFPLVLLETIAAETPFLISDLEWVKSYDIPEEFIVNFSYPEDVILKLLKLISKDSLESIKNIKKNFKDYFSHTKFIEDVNHVFRNLI